MKAGLGFARIHLNRCSEPGEGLWSLLPAPGGTVLLGGGLGVWASMHQHSVAPGTEEAGPW